jgi:Tol biopolymer transport system component
MNIDGTGRKLLIKGNHWSPSWSPDGQWLVFITNNTLQVINLQGDSTRTFQGVNNVPLSFPDWSKDGRSILFNSSYVNGGGVFISDPLFFRVRQLFNQYQFSGFSARWSPNCEKVIYQKVSHSWKGGEIFIIDTLGVEDNRITYDNMDDREPALSPSGDLVVCSKNVGIYVMNSDGSNQYKLDYGQHPAWSPDSQYIYYSNANSDFTKEVLWKIDINGKNKVQLTY